MSCVSLTKATEPAWANQLLRLVVRVKLQLSDELPNEPDVCLRTKSRAVTYRKRSGIKPSNYS